MPSQAANIGDLQHGVAGQFPLHSEIELLDVGPDGMGGNGEQAQRELQPCSADLVVGSKLNWFGVCTTGAVPSSASELLSLPLVCSKKMP